MTFYLIGLGLDIESISLNSIEILKKASKIYLETYTVEFPYSLEDLENRIGKRILPLTRIMVENEKFVEEAKEKDIVLLVYGAPMMATTHISLILKCKKENIKYNIKKMLAYLMQSQKQDYRYTSLEEQQACQHGLKNINLQVS